MTKNRKRIRTPRTKKNILSVTIRRMTDESPDTSHMGEYAQRPASEFSIDRAHAEDCESLKPGIKLEEDWASWNGSASEALERVRVFLEEYQAQDSEHESSPNGCAMDCQACEEEQPYKDAFETVWELEKNAGECDCTGGDMERGEYRYFNPSFNYVTKDGKPADGLTPEEVRKYTRQDYERMQRLHRGDWAYIGIRAEAEVIANVEHDSGVRIAEGSGLDSNKIGTVIPWNDPRTKTVRTDYPFTGGRTPQSMGWVAVLLSDGKVTTVPAERALPRWHGIVQRVTSGGLWGIESDSERSYIEQEQANQLAELKTELLALGFSKRAIATAFKNVEEKDE